MAQQSSSRLVAILAKFAKEVGNFCRLPEKMIMTIMSHNGDNDEELCY